MSAAAGKPTAAEVSSLAERHSLSASEAQLLTPYLSSMQLQSGEVLWNEGEQSSFAAFILSGRVEEKKATEFADKKFVVGVYSKGAVLGENSLLDELPRPLSVACLDDAELLILSREKFDQLQQEQPQLAIKIFKATTQALAIRLRKAFERMAAIF